MSTGGVDNGRALGRSSDGELRATRPREMLWVNTRLQYREVRQMVVFMSEGQEVDEDAQKPHRQGDFSACVRGAVLFG